MRPRRWLRRLLWIGCTLGVLSGLGVLALWWRLHQGPIRIDFLQPRIEEALGKLIAPVSLRLGGTTLNWVGGGRPVEIRATDIEVLNPAGVRLVSFAEVGVGLYSPVLLRGELVPTEVVIRNTHAVLKRNEDGSFELGLGDTAETSERDEPTGDVKEWLDQWLDPKDPDSALARLAEISIVDSRIDVHDRMMGVDWGADRVDISLKRQDRSVKARASFSLEVGDHKSELTADLVYGVSDDVSNEYSRFGGTLNFQRIQPWAFADLMPELAQLSLVRFTLDGQVTFAVANKRLESLDFDLTGGTGELSLPELYSVPVAVRGTRIKGSIEGDLEKIEIERAEVNLRDMQATARLSARRRGDDYRGTLNAGIGKASVRQVGDYWPSGAGAAARAWVVENISAGTVSNIALDMAASVTLGDSTTFDVRSLTSTFDFAGLEIDALSPQPPITGLDGTATMSTERLDFEVRRGGMRGLEITSSKAAITNLAGDGPSGLSLRVAVGGPVDPIAGLLCDRPLELVSRDLLDGLGGQAEFEFELELPLADGADSEATRISANARLRDVVWPESPVPLGNRAISDGDLELTLDDESLDVRGTLKLSGIPARVEFRGKPRRR